MHNDVDTRYSVQVNARYNVQHKIYRRASKCVMKQGWYERLIEAIKSDGRSVRAISLEAKCGPNYVQQMMTDGKRPTVDKLMAILEVLGEARTFEVLTGEKIDDEDIEFIRLSSGLDSSQKKAALDFFRSLLTKQGDPAPEDGSRD
ncbi:hypothetical protein [Agrobacterium sp. CG674]